MEKIMTMPNFLVIGAGKSGTTSVYYYLNQHPQIFMCPLKEPRFFCFEGEKVNFQGPGDLKMAYVTDLAKYGDLFRGVSNQVAKGEASTWYLCSPKAPYRIKNHIPDAKLIAILRDPVERAYSHWLHVLSERREPLSDFAPAMEAEKERISNNWSPHWHYMRQGFYYAHLKRYFDLFPQEQIRVYFYEDLVQNPQAVMKSMYEFLSVDHTFIPDMSRKYRVSGMTRSEVLKKFLKQSNPIKRILRHSLPSNLCRAIKNNLEKINIQKMPPLSPNLRKQWVGEYREDILRLQDLVQRDLSDWLKTPLTN